MRYARKQIKVVITIPKTEMSSGDYIKLFWDAGTGTMITTPIATLYGSNEGTNYIYRWSTIIVQPGSYSFQYTAFDKAGNEGTSSSVITNIYGLVPYIPGDLYYISYADQTLTLGIK